MNYFFKHFSIRSLIAALLLLFAKINFTVAVVAMLLQNMKLAWILVIVNVFAIGMAIILSITQLLEENAQKT